ncbi:RNA polymerase sigma-70 factor [Pedobacter caeni]|uniref:RNA polymerase sigma-70 factor, ECF subfamily n=1 Tax=Pedobacter caeni TaxID=288992 RepID=A0A1M5DHZ6_9SPHI|nr:RNA polymerase sigma-70 factor [Pedobacter caeni]SHF66535.1 RNA polymerase sigma-70 factor, ECF subfamily [Pedobacter caeni]
MSARKSIDVISGNDLLLLIEDNNKDAFTDFYSHNFRKLILVSDKYVQGVPAAEEIVQDVFLKIWEEKELLSEIKSIKAYLYRSVVNASINFVNRQKNIEKHHLKIADHVITDDTERHDEENELITLLYDEIELLPEKCQKVFKLSRLEGLKYRDIALQLNISEKTVENHMGNALKILRSRVSKAAEQSPVKKKFKYFYLLAVYLY